MDSETCSKSSSKPGILPMVGGGVPSRKNVEQNQNSQLGMSNQTLHKQLAS